MHSDLYFDFINENDNLCISGIFGWDFNLISSQKVFVICVRQLNTTCMLFLFNYVSTRQGRETYCFSPCVCLSVCLSVRHKSCSLYNLKTVKDFSMKLGTLVDHDETMCHAQEP